MSVDNLRYDKGSCCFEEIKMKNVMSMKQQLVFNEQKLNLLGSMSIYLLLPERMQSNVQQRSTILNHQHANNVMSETSFLFDSNILAHME